MAAHTHSHGGHGGNGDHGDQGDWEVRAAEYAEMADRLEPELGKATKLMLQAAGIRPGIQLLDLACGPGHATAAAHKAGAAAWGLDASPAMINIASTRFPGPTFVQGDMRTPPSGPWDAVTCRMGGHHADSAWIAASFAVLKPGGRLAIVETDAVDEEARAKGMLSPAEWVRLFEAAGFVEVRVMDSGVDGAMLAEIGRVDHSGERGHQAPGFPKGAIYVIAGSKPMGG